MNDSRIYIRVPTSMALQLVNDELVTLTSYRVLFGLMALRSRQGHDLVANQVTSTKVIRETLADLLGLPETDLNYELDNLRTLTYIA